MKLVTSVPNRSECNSHVLLIILFAKLLKRLALIFTGVPACLQKNVIGCEKERGRGSCPTTCCKFIMVKVLVTNGKNFLDLHITINFNLSV